MDFRPRAPLRAGNPRPLEIFYGYPRIHGAKTGAGLFRSPLAVRRVPGFDETFLEICSNVYFLVFSFFRSRSANSSSLSLFLSLLKSSTENEKRYLEKMVLISYLRVSKEIIDSFGLEFSFERYRIENHSDRGTVTLFTRNDARVNFLPLYSHPSLRRHVYSWIAQIRGRVTVSYKRFVSSASYRSDSFRQTSAK